MIACCVLFSPVHWTSTVFRFHKSCSKSRYRLNAVLKAAILFNSSVEVNAPAAVLLLLAPIRMRSSSPRAEAVRRPSPTGRTSPCTPHAAARTRFTSVVCWRRSPASHGSGTFRRSASFTGQYAMRTEPQSLIWRRQYVVRRRRCCDHFVTTYVGMCLGVWMRIVSAR